ncbi:MAG: GMC family oxidoreductase [Bdellovibrio sp. CG_4_9_14_3_um_filter_39_7]|nr:MAG: GMC family oxidoreductase [Bdellovibrio sp. CG_4_9_14_3_um_filter_39_7]
MSDQVVEADIVIIGSGAGGGEAAKLLSKHFNVVIVEEGPHRTSNDFKMKESIAYPELYQDSGARLTVDGAIKILQGKSVGGSTTVNWTSSFRTPQETLLHWNKEFGIHTLTQDSLLSHFLRIEDEYGITPWDGEPNLNNQLMANGMSKLGIRHGVIPRNVKGCLNLGYCGMGCPTNAKQSTLINAIPRAIENGAKLFSQFRVERLIWKNDKIVEAIAYSVTPTGKIEENKKTLTLKAQHFLLCGGGINTPILLMKSDLPDPYFNIGNRTFLHPVTVSLALFNQKVEAYQGAPQSVYSDQFLWPEDDSLGFKIEAPPIHPALTSSLINQHGSEASEMMKRFSHSQGMIALGRDGFHEQAPGGKIVMTSNGRFGLDYPWNDYLTNGYKKALLTMASIQFEAGARSVYPLHRFARSFERLGEVKSFLDSCSVDRYDLQIVSAHVMGGAAMGSDEKNSVVDNDGRFHHMSNLFIFDGSLFPTSLGVNPTESILSFSSLLTHKLIERIK